MNSKLLAGGDHFIRHVARDDCVVRELKVRDAAACGEGAELRCEAEELGERDPSTTAHRAGYGAGFCGDDALLHAHNRSWQKASEKLTRRENREIDRCDDFPTQEMFGVPRNERVRHTCDRAR